MMMMMMMMTTTMTVVSVEQRPAWGERVEHMGYQYILPHKAVAEVSKIGNL